MKSYLVVTITCPDRPGIVERITEVLVAHAANWEESRLARLGGDFAGIVRISAPPERVPALTQAFQALAAEQISVLVKATNAGADGAPAGGALYQLRLAGADHEGIVHRVAAYLAGQGINVESLDTEVVLAPISATPLFQMQAQIKVPSGLTLAELTANLQRIGDDLGVDIDLGPSAV